MTATAPTVPPADGAALPTPPSTLDPVNFDPRADAYFLAEVAFQVAMNLLKANVYTNTTAAYQNALATALDAASTAANAALAATYAGAAPWVSGTTYAQYVVVSSPANGRLYRKLTTSVGGAVDPSANGTDWAPVSSADPYLLITGLVQQAVSGGAYAFANVTLQAAATNLALYSNQADNAAWTKSGCTVSADFALSPTGNTDADKLIESAINELHFDSQSSAVAANVQYTYSREIKAQGRTNVVLVMDKDGAGTDGVRATFDLTTGAVSAITNIGAGSGAAATATYLGGGYWLCTLTGTPGAAAGTSVRYATYIDAFAAYLGDGTSGICVAEAQLETGAAATSRIATTSATVARAANVIAPSRLVLPLTPGADAVVSGSVANGIATNVIDPNGSTIMGTAGAMVVDNANGEGFKLQNINNTWRLVK